jgi:hypothetical protein
MIDLSRKAEAHWFVQTHDPFLCQSLGTSSILIDPGPSGTAQLITPFRVNLQSNMASQFIRAMLVLLLMAPIGIFAHLHLRQTALSQTATPTANPGQQTASQLHRLAVGLLSARGRWVTTTGTRPLWRKPLVRTVIFTHLVQRADRILKPLL